jgi:hypothetical protein
LEKEIKQYVVKGSNVSLLISFPLVQVPELIYFLSWDYRDLIIKDVSIWLIVDL